MEGLFFLIIVAFLFAVTGVIVLLVRTYRQGELLRKYGRRLTRLEEDFRLLLSGPPPAGIPAGKPERPDAVPEAISAEPVFTGPEAPVTIPPAADIPRPEPPMPAAFLPEETFPAAKPPGTGEPAAAKASSGLKHSLTAFIHSGNLWAAGGVLLLTAAFAMLIAYLANRGFFTVEMGIAAAAFSGLVMLASGWRFRKKRPVYFLLLQGGGIGILYLSVFAAHKLTPHFPSPAALFLMILLVVPAVILALVQNSQALALLGFLGGCAAPLLLAPGGGNQVFLFSYYGVLDLGVLAISLFRHWKGLHRLAFFSTFILANYWTARYYEPALFGRTESFFLAYILIFTILGLHTFHGKNNGARPSVDLVLALGTPMAGAALQWRIFDPIPHGHALICLIFSAFYILLAFIIRKHRNGERRIFSEGYIGFGLLLANLAIPLELAPRITSAAWAAEGVAAFFFGLRLKNFKAAAAGLVLHLAAAIAFAAGGNIFPYGEGAFRSARFTGSLVIALAALALVFFAGRSSPFPEPKSPEGRSRRAAFPVILGIWAFVWWFGGWSWEIYRALTHPQAVLFLFCSVSALGSFAGSKFLRSPVYRIGMIPAPVLGLFIPLSVFLLRIPVYAVSQPWLILSRNFFEGLFLWGWPVFFAVQGMLLFLTRKNLREDLHGIWLLTVISTGLGVLSSSGRALTLSRGLAPAWTSFAGMAPLFIAMAGINLLSRRIWPESGLGGEASPLGRTPLRPTPLSGEPPQRPPESSPAQAGFRKKLVLFTFPLVLSCVMGLWFFVTLFLSGDPAPLPFYIPLINPLDLEEAFCIVIFLLWQSVLLKRGDLPGMKKPALFIVIDSAIFLFTIAVTARSVHFYGGVPYHRVFRSDVFHLCLFILWAVYGIGHIIGGFKASLRQVWIAGAVLMAADIAKLLILDLAGTGAVTRIASFFIAGFLLLFIGWAAPLPPAVKKKTALPPDSRTNP